MTITPEVIHKQLAQTQAEYEGLRDQSQQALGAVRALNWLLSLMAEPEPPKPEANFNPEN